MAMAESAHPTTTTTSKRRRYKACPLTESGEHLWEDIAESRDYDGWYQWCSCCGALKSPKGRGIVFQPLRDEVKK